MFDNLALDKEAVLAEAAQCIDPLHVVILKIMVIVQRSPKHVLKVPLSSRAHSG